MDLRSLLLGPALCDREAAAADPTLAALTRHVEGIAPLLHDVYGTSTEAQQAEKEIAAIAVLGDGTAEAACKRAALLFALHIEPEVQQYFGADPLARDLTTRVLPLVVPRFIKHSCQTPDAFVTLCLTLAEMWPGEPMGNWPRERAHAARDDDG